MRVEQVDKLYDYTKFHIGLYTALITAVTTVLGLTATEQPGVERRDIAPFLVVTLFFLVIAGMAGGVIGSTLSLDSEAVRNDKKIGPLDKCWFTARTWAHLEHWAFWLGICSTILGVVVGLFTRHCQMHP
jgi:hypothetical protein